MFSKSRSQVRAQPRAYDRLDHNLEHQESDSRVWTEQSNSNQHASVNTAKPAKRAPRLFQPKAKALPLRRETAIRLRAERVQPNQPVVSQIDNGHHHHDHGHHHDDYDEGLDLDPYTYNTSESESSDDDADGQDLQDRQRR